MTRFDPDGDLDFQLQQLLNGGLTLGDNFEGSLLEVSLEEGENKLQHNLGYVPLGYLVIYKEANTRIFGARADEWTREHLFLESSAENPRVRLFVL